MLEKSVEAYLSRRVTAAGGVCLKLNPAWYKGIPDRLIVVHRTVVFVELKRPSGGVIGKMQDWWRTLLQGHGARHHDVLSTDEVDAMLGMLASVEASRHST